MWEIATPSELNQYPAITMAGFRDRSGDVVDLQVIPYPAVTVVFDLGPGLVVDDTRGCSWRGSIAAGLAPGSVRGHGRDMECIQIRLSPLAAPAMLGIGPALGTAVVSLEDVWGRDASRIEDQLRSASSWETRFSVIEAAFARHHNPRWVVEPEIVYAWTEMARLRGQARVEQLATAVGWSRKRLWARFRSEIGMTPKLASQLIRFDYAVHDLAAGRSPARVAVENGYADQSHLHRQVVSFAGLTPVSVAEAPWLAVDDVAWPSPTS